MIKRTIPSYLWYSDRVELTNLIDNKTQIQAKAQDIADQKVREFDQSEAGTRLYAGIWPVNLDGAIEQVSWSFSATQPALTHVGRQMEVEMPLIGHDEKRSKQLTRHSAVHQEMERQNNARPDRRTS